MPTKTPASKMKFEMKEQINALRANYVDRAKAIIQGGANELFEKWPRLKSFGVVGYTPYYSDGDPTTFSVDAWNPHINGIDHDYEEGEVEGENLYEATDDEAALIVVEVKKFFREIPDQIFNELFEDHFKLTITPEGFKLEEYDHE